MNDIIQRLTAEIKKIVFGWTSKFHYYVEFTGHKSNHYNFIVDFSLPTKLNPVPKAKVKVFFTCEEVSDGDFHITFRFENQSLIHKLDNTIRSSQVESWIERILKEKELTRGVLFLGTEFEAERIKDEKVEVIFKEAVLNPVAIQLRNLNESLLSNSIDFTKSEASMDEKTLDLLKNTMFDFFRGVDKNDMGVVSYQECREVLRAMDIELSDVEVGNLMQIADKNANGMVEYKEFIPIGAEVLYGVLLKQQTEKELDLEDEMLVNQAILVLYNDEIHDLAAAIFKECKALDEDLTGVVPTSGLFDIFKKSEKLNEREYEPLYRKIQADYPKDFNYSEISNILFKYKVDIIKNGLAENNVTKLELYLRKLFEIFDEHKTGKIPAQTVLEALKKADKILLSQMQLYILRNFVKKDKDNNVDYIRESKFLAEMIKKFFSPSVLKKQAQFVENGGIKSDAYVEGWTREALINQMNEIFQTYDVDKDKMLDRNEYRRVLAKAEINLSEEEFEKMMQEADKDQDGFLDFTEFQSHFFNVLKLIRRNKALSTISAVA